MRKTVSDLIKELQNLPDALKEKEVKIVCPNGLQIYPHIKRSLINKYDVLNHGPDNIDKIFLTWD